MCKQTHLGIFLICLSVLSLAQAYTFDDYVIQFGKAYPTKQQYDLRKEIFQANYTIIQENNLRNDTNILSPTTWTDRTLDQIQGVLSTKPDINSVGSPFPISEQKISAPVSIDWRNSSCVSKIKDQGYCGSCWAFASTATYESYVAIKTGRLYDLAEQELLQCTLGSSCYGGSIEDAMSTAVNLGISLQSTYPYTAKYTFGNYYSKYPGICTPKSPIRLPANTSSFVFLNLTSEQIKSRLSQSPMSIAIWVNSEFMQFRGSGAFSCKRQTTWWDLNHAVELIGYDANGNYIIKNSWGTMWGNMGYIVLDRAYGCGVGLYSVQYSNNRDTNGNGTTNSTTNTATNSTTDGGSLTKLAGWRNLVCGLAMAITLILGML